MQPSLEQYQIALETLKNGGIVAYPTETFYGLAVDPLNDQAISALYTLKKEIVGNRFRCLFRIRLFLARIYVFFLPFISLSQRAFGLGR